MAIRLDSKIKSILDILHSKRFRLKGIRNGIRAKLENGVDVDIYTLKSNPEHVRARVKIKNGNEAARKAALVEAQATISRGLQGLAHINDFHFSREGNGIYHYYAIIRMDEKDGAGNFKHGAEENDTEQKKTQNPIEKAVAMLEGIDARTFRKSLDDLGLPRSSILRVALMHLYRAALDADELRTALTDESEKITAPSDLAMLERIRENNKTDFLTPLLQALWDASDRQFTIVID